MESKAASLVANSKQQHPNIELSHIDGGASKKRKRNAFNKGSSGPSNYGISMQAKKRKLEAGKTETTEEGKITEAQESTAK